jgi:hypothetical protein
MQIDPAALTAAVGLIGSLVGDASTFAASWFTQHGQLRAQMAAKRSTAREGLIAATRQATRARREDRRCRSPR